MTDTAPVLTAMIQFQPRVGDRADNVRRMEQWARRAAREGAHVVVFPECSMQGIVFDSHAESLAAAEPIDGPGVTHLAGVSAELQVALVFGFLERDGDTYANAVVFLLPDGSRSVYRKTHLTELGADRWATRGDCIGDIVVFRGVRFGTIICYDIRFPEASRVVALAGADVILDPTNSPVGYEGTYDHAARTRAWENRVWFLAVNRVGDEVDSRFIGRSIAVDPLGAPVAQLSGEGEEMALVTIDPAASRSKLLPGHQGSQYDFTSARRPDLYDALTAVAPSDGTAA